MSAKRSFMQPGTDAVMRQQVELGGRLEPVA